MKITLKKIALSSAIATLYSSPSIAAVCTGSSNNVTISSDCGSIVYSGTGANGGSVTINSSATIAGDNANGLSVYNTGQITTLTNNGTINSTHDASAFGIYTSNSIGTLTNNGVISLYGAGVNIASGSVGTINNTGTITSSSYIGIINSGAITTLTNTGMITGAYGDLYNFGSISVMNNSQSNFYFSGNLPTNYNVIVYSTSNYGQLVGVSPSGNTIFGVSSLSTLTTNLYTGVLQGINSSQISNFSGHLGAATWHLVEEGSSTNWDLNVTGSYSPAAYSPTAYAQHLLSGNFITNGAATTINGLGSGSGAMANVITALTALSPAQQSAALQRITPVTNRSAQLSSRNTVLSTFDQISYRLDPFRTRITGMNSGDSTTMDGFWFKPFGGGMDQSAKSGFGGYNGSNWGLSGGFDHLLWRWRNCRLKLYLYQNQRQLQ